jgi:amino acid transporter
LTQRKTNTKFGTAPVFFTAISTILGAILFLRFGFAVGTVGFWGAILIILLGHMVTVPTALALSEIATNKRVEGGGEYFIISRSFGINIGATIGIALFLSQAISVAFYVIAFTEAFDFAFDYVREAYNIMLPKQAISIPSMLVLAALILSKGAKLGVKALYLVVAVLAASLVLFFIGKTDYAAQHSFSILHAQFRNKESFFIVFAIIFPAFTGMNAGVGLSGDLKKPARSIPIGTILATAIGMIIYFLLVYKFAVSASPDDLMKDQMIMGKIAVYGAIAVPVGLAASTISSALGSVMVAPRTLQALAMDKAFPVKPLNNWLAKGREKDNEPINASLVTVLIALVFVSLGNINSVASIISMFFMVTYGSLCLISVLNHFGSSPAYRPSFKSKWYLSLTGFLVSIWVMFKISTPYALLSFVLMAGIYLYLKRTYKNRRGFASIFSNAIFQLNRNLQVYLQKKHSKGKFKEWRPSAICISRDSFKRDKAFRLLSWIAYKYGFGTYLHRIEGYYSKETKKQSEEELKRLIQKVQGLGSHVYVDTIISPSYTSAIAQAIQIPGIAGMENNMVIFEYDKNDPESLTHILENFALVNAGDFDVIILASTQGKIQYKNGIHIWIRSTDTENANLMILLSFIILGHPDWNLSDIKIFNICQPEEENEIRKKMHELVTMGRLPITSNNIMILVSKPEISPKELVNKYSADAGLTMIGFRAERVEQDKEKTFEGYDKTGTVMFVHSHDQKIID